MRESYVARALPSSPPSGEVHRSGPPAEADSVDDHGVQPQWLTIKPRPELPHDSMLLLSDDPILEQPVDTKPEPRLEINTVLTELVYLLHFERPFHGPMQHYVGSTDDLDLCLDAACDWSYRRRGAGISVFTAAELGCLRQKPRLARIAAVTLFRPRLSYR